MLVLKIESKQLEVYAPGILEYPCHLVVYAVVRELIIGEPAIVDIEPILVVAVRPSVAVVVVVPRDDFGIWHHVPVHHDVQVIAVPGKFPNHHGSAGSEVGGPDGRALRHGANARARRYAVHACGNDQENGCPDELPQEHSNSVRCIVPVNWFSPRDGIHAVDLLRLRGSPQATRRAGARENFPHHDL